MLKIKDNVDLKELEKFGFKYEERSAFNSFYTHRGLITINVGGDDREFYILGTGTYECDPDALDVIFALIQAGLVEGVADGEDS